MGDGGISVNTDREMLIAMDGKIDRVLDRQTDAKQRHEELAQRVHGHSNRFMELDRRITSHDVVLATQSGVRTGVAGTVRVAWVFAAAIGSALVTVVAAVVARHLGV